jgi:hypothetical protein
VVVTWHTEDALGRVVRITHVATLSSATDTRSVFVQMISTHANSANLRVFFDSEGAVLGHQVEVGDTPVSGLGESIPIIAFTALSLFDVSLASSQRGHWVLTSVVSQDLAISTFETLVGWTRELGLNTPFQFRVYTHLLGVFVVLEYLVGGTSETVLGICPSRAAVFDLLDTGVFDEQMSSRTFFTNPFSRVVGAILNGYLGLLTVVVVHIEPEFTLDTCVFVLVLDTLEFPRRITSTF